MFSMYCHSNTKCSPQEVVSKLNMSGCEFVSTSPDRPNIFYEVCPRMELEVDMHSILVSLREQRVQAPRVLIYCMPVFKHKHVQIYMPSFIMN